MTFEPLDLDGTFAEAKARAVNCLEAAYLEALMRRCEGNLMKASRQAELARNHLRELLKKHGQYKPGVPSGKPDSTKVGDHAPAPKLPRPGLVRLVGMP
jgi:hypothetical protein